MRLQRARRRRPDSAGSATPRAGFTTDLRAGIRVEGLVKQYRGARVVDDVTFEVAPGRVTALLGPNGAGKTTTIRIVLGLAAASSGRALVAGRPYREHPEPLRVVGAMLDGPGAHPGRTARRHLDVLAAANGTSSSAVMAGLLRVGLGDVADRRVGTFSLGMRQRLGLAAALLGDPGTVVLDEPGNGLDPDGQVWLRRTIRELAGQGRAVMVASHVLADVATWADDVLVMHRGRVLADGPVNRLLRSGERLEDAFLRLVTSDQPEGPAAAVVPVDACTRELDGGAR
jgi:ABC-2 type transport system ATP-binding protein